MNKVRPFFRVEIGASEKSADVKKICDKKNCHLPNQIREKAIKFQINAITLSKVLTFLYEGSDPPLPQDQIGLDVCQSPCQA